jgi:3',5'-cyclic AMP phosphodiesterase CpdA
MRIAHISDLHVLALAGAVPFRLFNKRATGYANLRLRRHHQHKSEIVRAIATHLAAAKVDHVVITGDVTNLALESEFEAVRGVLDDVLGLPHSAVTIVPGNHDVYTRGAEKKRRFSQFFAPYLSSDLPHFRTEQPGGHFPIVKLRGPVAIIGLSTALARLPFVASGRLGLAQLLALEKILASPEVQNRTPVLLLHHPIFNPAAWTKMKARLEGLEDAAPLRELLAHVPRGLLLHGHLHRRIHHKLPTHHGHIDVVGATSASLVHPSPARMAGYNLYEIADDGVITTVRTFAYDQASGDFQPTSLPGPDTEARAAS